MQTLPDVWGPHKAVVRVQAGPRYEPQDLPGVADALVQAATSRAEAAGAEVEQRVGPEEVLFVLDCVDAAKPASCLQGALAALARLQPVPGGSRVPQEAWSPTEAWWAWAWQGHAYARMAAAPHDGARVTEPQRAAVFQREAWSRGRWHVHHGEALTAASVQEVLAELPVSIGPDEALMRPLAAPSEAMAIHHAAAEPGPPVRGHVGLPRDLSPSQRLALWELWACAHPEADALDDLASWSLLRATDAVWLGVGVHLDPLTVACTPGQVAARAQALVPAPDEQGAGIVEARRLLQDATEWALYPGAALPEGVQARPWPVPQAAQAPGDDPAP